MHLPDQDLARLDRIEATLSSCRKTGSVTRFEHAFRFNGELAAGDVHVNEGRIRDGDAIARLESHDVERAVTVAEARRATSLLRALEASVGT